MRLIDADKLKNHYAWWEGGSQEMTLDEAKHNFDTIVDLQPTVDAVEVVRCEDCIHYKNINHVINAPVDLSYGFCETINRYIPETFYCAYGERREDDI